MANTPITLPKLRRNNDRSTWHGLAFIMEALILLIFLVISIAVLMQVFGAAHTHGQNADSLSRSVTLASNEAELFNANPSEETESFYIIQGDSLTETDGMTEGAFRVSRTVVEESTDGGTLYHATIVVERNNSDIYEITSTRYVSGAEVKR